MQGGQEEMGRDKARLPWTRGRLCVVLMTFFFTFLSISLLAATFWGDDGVPDTAAHLPDEMPLIRQVAEMPREMPHELKDDKHGVKMGVTNALCDDGKTNLTLDWCDVDKIHSSSACAYEYTNLQPSQPIISDEPLQSLNGGTVPAAIYHDYHVPDSHFPEHYCMQYELSYSENIPSVGPHRPLWPVFGEYLYVPPQRWLHSIEHGAVVFLYHPHTAVHLVQQVRQIVTSCIRKHIITPYRKLSVKRPLALVAWSNVMQFAKVDGDAVKAFIKSKALHGPEGHLSKEGQYDVGLIKRATAPPGSDLEDSNLCPSAST